MSINDNDDKIREELINALNRACFDIDMMYVKSNRLFWQFSDVLHSFQKLLDYDDTGKYDDICNSLIEIFKTYTDLVDKQELSKKEIDKCVDEFEKYRP